MRTVFVFAVALLSARAASAATLKVEVSRQNFTGPIEVAVASREEGRRPDWSSPKKLSAGKSSASFDGLAPGLYAVMVSGPQPLQRLSAKANVGSNGGTIRVVIPQSTTEVRATVGGQPLPHAAITFTHKELRWPVDVETGEDGRFAGALWEEGVYIASVRRVPTAGPYSTDVWLSSKPVTIDVPNRHVTGRILAAGKPLAGASVDLRSDNGESILNVRTQSGPDGRFEFNGVREGPLTLTARASSYLDSDALEFELHGAKARHFVDVELSRGQPRAVRVADTRGDAIAGATLYTSCDGHVKSTAVTSAEGRADVALPGAGTCAIYALPKEGSMAIAPVEGSKALEIRVPEGAASLRLAVKSVAGEPFSAMSLLMRIDGVVVPPAVARAIGSRGFPLITDEEGNIALQRIPRGTYEFWPYRTSVEGQMLYETATEFDAPISVKVLTGENNATVKFRAR